MKVLVVDDAKFMRVSLGNHIKNQGHEIVGEAENGEEAVTLYKELAPDLVTMDITMPVMDGIEAVKLIKGYDDNAKIVMVTAMGQKEFVMQAIQNGAMDFIVKPWDPEKIENVINKVKDSM